jgi:hypothetical protein
MSGKEQKPSKKAVREKKAKVIEDATFGLKNKNKSKKVQQFITRVEKSVKSSNGGADSVIISIVILMFVGFIASKILFCPLYLLRSVPRS